MAPTTLHLIDYLTLIVPLHPALICTGPLSNRRELNEPFPTDDGKLEKANKQISSVCANKVAIKVGGLTRSDTDKGFNGAFLVMRSVSNLC